MSKGRLIFMPIVFLLEGILYFGLSIWGIVMRECSSEITDIAANPFGFVMDITYFFDETCGNPTVIVAGLSEPVILVESNLWEPTISRTQAFLICYLVISALWILFSLLAIFTVAFSVRRIAQLFSYIWLFSAVFGGCILDAVATGFHIYDVVHTTSAENTFTYLGISTTEEAMTYIKGFDEYFVTPSLVMMCISSRILIVWILNVIGACHCVSLFKKHLKENFDATSSTILVVETETVNSR